MPDVQSTILDDRQAVDAFIDLARAVPGSAWARPRTPGKWSPAQVTEHVAIVYECAKAIVDGTFTGPSVPRIVRPLIRLIAVNPILRTGRFKTGLKAPRFFQPAATSTAATVDDLAARLRASAGAFEAAVESAARQGRSFVDHPMFGRVGLADYTRLQAIHTRHHAPQLGVERRETV